MITKTPADRSSGDETPRWMRDLVRFLPLKSQFVLSGNVRDFHVIEDSPGLCVPVPLVTALDTTLRQAGYEHVLVYEPVGGFGSATSGNAAAADMEILRSLGLSPTGGRAAAGRDLLRETLGRFVVRTGVPAALVVDFASRLVVRNEVLSDLEHNLFTHALVFAHEALPRPHGPAGKPFFNTIVWVVEKEVDLPDWMVIGNPRLRHIPVAKPDAIARRTVATQLLPSMPGAEGAKSTDLAVSEQAFVDETDGLLLADLMAIAELARTEGVTVAHIGDAVRRYKVGVTEDPWQRIDRKKIRDAASTIRQRVKGQDQAVTRVLDIIKRAIAGVGTTRRGRRPRGIAFLAGPTGVGKTELAKTVTKLLFGDEDAYIRFDMSEFSAEHADQRLIGAPPGYIGYDAGGQLTNAIREKPFSVVLFDEIEKAHPRILDKFLQILDDGVLTSGRGDRVYFTEALIVFTSNLGIYRIDHTGERVVNVSPDDTFEEVQRRVTAEIEHHFKLVINRPEILNRIGENVIVFDFIRAEVAREIFDQMIAITLAGVAEQGIRVSLSEEVQETLRALCLADLSHGGRGIRNQLEEHLVNPLARVLFDEDAQKGSVFEAVELKQVGVTTLRLRPVDVTR